MKVLFSHVNSLRPHELWPTRLLCPWNSPGQNSGVGCRFLLQGIEPTSPAFVGRLFTSVLPGKPIHFTLATPWTVFCQTPLSTRFSMQECLSGLLCPIPRDLPYPETEPRFPAWQAESSPSEPRGKLPVKAKYTDNGCGVVFLSKKSSLDQENTIHSCCSLEGFQALRGLNERPGKENITQGGKT